MRSLMWTSYEAECETELLITHYLGSTRSSRYIKLECTSSSSTKCQYFSINRPLRFWNSLPYINMSLFFQV